MDVERKNYLCRLFGFLLLLSRFRFVCGRDVVLSLHGALTSARALSSAQSKHRKSSPHRFPRHAIYTEADMAPASLSKARRALGKGSQKSQASSGATSVFRGRIQRRLAEQHDPVSIPDPRSPQ